VGQLCLLTGEANFYTCRAVSPSLQTSLASSPRSSVAGPMMTTDRRRRHFSHDPVIVAVLTKDAIEDILDRYPETVKNMAILFGLHCPIQALSLARNVVSLLSPVVRQVDFALDWVHIDSGKALFKQGDASDGTYIVLSGRLRSFTCSTPISEDKRMLDEFSRGDMVGLVGVVTGSARFSSVVATRDSELCRIPTGLLTLLQTR